MRLRLPICNGTRVGGDRTRRDDVAVGKPKIPSSGHVTIVRNKCLNTISHMQVKQQVHEKLYAKFQEQFENPDFYIGELMALASKAIRELPDEYRKAFEMNRFEEMTYNEIAERTGVSPKTIAYRISQALKILRTELKDYIPLLVWLLYEQTRS